jgi:hypothetical protein
MPNGGLYNAKSCPFLSRRCNISTYVIDVIPDPRPDNPAHAVIYANPDFVSPNHFRKLREHLARTHQIILLPGDE